MYYHIRIDYFDKFLKGNQTVFEFDYPDIDKVINEVVVPYIIETDFIFKGVKLKVVNIRQIQIFSSERDITYCTDFANDNVPQNVYMTYDNSDVLPYDNLVIDITKDVMKQTQDMLNNNRQANQTEISIVKKKMVFISHKHDDIDFVKDICDLLQDIGLDKSNLFCSSIPGFWIGLSKDIFESLRKLFNEYDLYVVFVQTPKYYSSPICLNEMGAAWVLQSQFCSILSKDMDFNDLKGVFDNHKTAIKVNNDDASSRLDELKNSILSFLGLSQIDNHDNTWLRNKDRFLRAANK